MKEELIKSQLIILNDQYHVILSTNKMKYNHREWTGVYGQYIIIYIIMVYGGY